MQFLSASSFWTPHFLVESAWHEHAPFAFWLTEAHRPGTYVELGAHHGFSYCCFCQAIERLGLETKAFAVDTWSGDAHVGAYDDEVFKRLADYNNRYSAFSRLVRSSFDDALAHFTDGFIDLLHIDGQHFYKDVKHDFSSWARKLSSRAIVLFHDTNVREGGFGVFQLWDEINSSYRSFEFLHGHGLGVLAFGPDQNPKMHDFFEAMADPKLACEVRTTYSHLGAAIRRGWELTDIMSRKAYIEPASRGSNAAELASIRVHVTKLVDRLRSSPFGVKLAAALRHPANSSKRKAYRVRHAQQRPQVSRPALKAPSRFKVNLRAFVRHPFSSRLRKIHRNRLHDTTVSALVAAAFGTTAGGGVLDMAGADANLFRCYVRNATGSATFGDFIPLSPQATLAESCDVKLIAYYLPQFHPISENDEWWGKGFTEWRNVARAFPVFEGHYQPRMPWELGYYDLRLFDTMRRQVELAKHHGISAFCFHFYWFGGKRLLELPIDAFLQNKELDIQFSLCWANENWSRRWDGGNGELLIAQTHSPEDDIAFIRYLDRYFRDKRYMKVDGKPVLSVYRPAILPNPNETTARWRQEATKLGYPGLYLIATNARSFKDYADCGFDALSEFPPHATAPHRIDDKLVLASVSSRAKVYSYESLVDREVTKASLPGIVHPGVMPGWDNSARLPYNGSIYHGATPKLFRRWLEHCFGRARHHRTSEQFLFINAWNEWAEGAYLEPDQRYGYAYLKVCAEVVRAAASATAERSEGAALGKQVLQA